MNSLNQWVTLKISVRKNEIFGTQFWQHFCRKRFIDKTLILDRKRKRNWIFSWFLIISICIPNVFLKNSSVKIHEHVEIPHQKTLESKLQWQLSEPEVYILSQSKSDGITVFKQNFQFNKEFFKSKNFFFLLFWNVYKYTFLLHSRNVNIQDRKFPFLLAERIWFSAVENNHLYSWDMLQ